MSQGGELIQIILGLRLITMEIYTESTSEATCDALRKLGDWLA